MQKQNRKIFKIILGAICCLVFLEGFSRIFVLPGSSEFIELKGIEQGLRRWKGKDEVRIFLYGESVMLGGYLYPNSTIGKWVHLYLEELLGKEQADRVKIINYARFGEGSRFISQAFIDTVVHEPDLVVIYFGHNEFVQADQRRKTLAVKGFTDRAEEAFKNFIKKSSLITALIRHTVRIKMEKRERLKVIENKNSKKQDRWYVSPERLAQYPKDQFIYPNSPQYNIILNNWENNVNRLISTAKHDNIPVVVLENVARMNYSQPLQPVHRKELAEDQLNQWEQWHGQAEEYFKNQQYSQALVFYQKCLALDDNFALTYYRLGQIKEYENFTEEANRYYVKANDLDYFPLNSYSGAYTVFDRLKKEEGRIHVIPTRAIFEKASSSGIIGPTLMIDHQHPTITGQALMAEEIVKTIYEHEYYLPKEYWHWEQLPRWEDLLKKIDFDDEFKFNMNIETATHMMPLYDKSIEYVKEALKIKPDSILARSQLAWIYWQKGEKERATAIYRDLSGEVPQMAEEFFKKNPEIYKEPYR